MKLIGLTGGIASGKSTAARYLEARGAHLVDADRLGHRAYEPGTSAYQAVVATFGTEVIGADHQIDRRALGQKVFARPEALKQLTDIVWPEIRRLAQLAISAVRDGDPEAVVVLEAAVLLEAGWEDMVDEIWVVVTDRDCAVRRAMERDGADEAAVQQRIDAQLSNEERVRHAAVVLENNNDLAGLEAQVDAQWQRVTG